MFLLNNISSFAEFCFWPALLWGAVGLIGFWRSPDWRRNPAIRLGVVLLAVMLGWRLGLPIVSKRYMAPTVIPVLILATAGILGCWHGFRENRSRRLAFILLMAVSVALSGAKLLRGGDLRKKHLIGRVATVLRDDWARNGYRNVCLLGNSKETGRMFFYAGLDGKFFVLADGSRMRQVLQESASQFEACYLVWLDDPKSGTPMPDWSSGHSYRLRVLKRPEAAGEPWIGKVVSEAEVDFDAERIDAFLNAAPGPVLNSDFQHPVRQRIAGGPVAGAAFLPSGELLLPESWGLNAANWRGHDFSDWKVDYEPDCSGRHRLRFSGRAGLLFRNFGKIAPGNCQLRCVVRMTPGALLYFCLYACDRQGRLLGVQNVGVVCGRCRRRMAVSFGIRARDLPPDTAFFQIGCIAWNGSVTLEKIDLAPLPGAVRSGEGGIHGMR